MPASGWCRPSIISIVVVLPAPLGPRRPKISPRATSKLTPSTAFTAPYALRTSPTRMTASPAPGALGVGVGKHGVHGPPDGAAPRAERCPCRPAAAWCRCAASERAGGPRRTTDGSASSARSASCRPSRSVTGLSTPPRRTAAVAPRSRSRRCGAFSSRYSANSRSSVPAHLLAVGPELPERLLDLRREHRLRQLRLRPEDRLPDALEHPLRAAEQQERRATRRPEHLRRLAPKACRDIDRGATGGLEADDLLVEACSGR